MCYVTLRGLVYFGASIHVYHGVSMLVSMYYDLFATSSPIRQVTQVTHTDILFNSLFLTIGVLLFRGVEQKSKTFIKWPTIAFTLLLAARFILEIVKQVERERDGVARLKSSSLPQVSPFSYSSMSIDVDPLISAAVGIYIFILFVYNHSLEYAHPPHSPQLPTCRHSLSSECGGSDTSSDTVLLLNTNLTTNTTNGQSGDTNNNRNNGGVTTRNNPLFELERGHPQRPSQLAMPHQFRDLSPSPTEYKVDAV